MMTTSEIINFILEKEKIKAGTFAKRIGVVPTQIYDLQKGKIKKISDEMADKIISVYPTYSRIWLLTGEGKMTNDTAPKVELQEISTEDNIGELYIENLHGAKFYELGNGKFRMVVKQVPFCAYGRFANEADTLEPDKEDWEVESYEVSQIVHGNYLSFEVKGESMDDGTRQSFEAGDRILVRELDRIHWTEKLRYRDYPYWVVVFDSSVLIKQIIHQDLENGTITFHSLNPSPEYCDFQLSLNDIRKLYYVVQKKPRIVNY